MVEVDYKAISAIIRYSNFFYLNTSYMIEVDYTDSEIKRFSITTYGS